MIVFKHLLVASIITIPAPPRHAHGDLTCLAPHERLPEVLIVPREKTPMGTASAAAAAAAAAKSFQSCPTLCDPIDGSPPGPAVPGVL